MRGAIPVPDKCHIGRYKSAVPEYVIGMSVRVDHVANRLGGFLLQRGKKLPSFNQASAGVDHGHGVVADNGAEVGDIADIAAVHQCCLALMREDARRDFFETKALRERRLCA